MNIIRKIITAGVATLALGGMAATTAAAASASMTQVTSSRPLPKIQTGIGLPTGWNHTWQVRPGFVYFGGGAGYSAPRIKNLHWTHYSRHSAYARGRWLVDNCKPNCARAGYFVSAGAYFYGVFNHAGPGRNFGNVKITWTQHGYRHSMHLWIDSAGQWNWR